MLLGKLTWSEVSDIVNNVDFVIVPIGSTEQHGEHLPLDNDAYTALEISKLVTETLKEKLKILIAPPIPYGMSEHHMDFPGTITLKNETLINVIKDICISLSRHGFKKILILNGHGGNTAAIRAAIQELNLEYGLNVYTLNWWDLVSDVIKSIYGTPITHADESETAVAYALNQRVVKELMKGSGNYGEETALYTVKRMKKYTSTGSMGHPEKALKEHGEIIVNSVVNRLAEELLRLSKQ
ncbi:MAG: creatininase family protein [Thermoprotei archaeon]